MDQKILMRKKVLKGNVTRLVSDTKKENDLAQLELLETKCQKFGTDLEEVFFAIYEQCEEKDADAYVTEQQVIQDSLDEIFVALKRQRAKLNNGVSSSISGTDNNSSNKTESSVFEGMRLPRITLPTYNGAIESWLSFRDLFKSSVYNNTSLSGSQKLAYLKLCLQGEASRVIQSIAISDSNFDIAWSLLEERYSNTRDQVYAHLRRFMNIPVIQNESPSAILNLVDVANESIRSLEVLNQKIENFSETMLAYILVQKLDPATKLWWEREIKAKTDDLPKISDLLAFLKEHSRTLSAAKENVNMKRNSSRLSSLMTGVTNKNNKSDRKCAACNQGSHYLSRCIKFQNFSVRERLELLKKQNLCFLCFGHHSVRNCDKSFNCSHCQRKHNRLICFHNEKSRPPDLDNKKPNINVVAISEEDIMPQPSRVNNDHALNAEAIPFEINKQNSVFSGNTNICSKSKTVILPTACANLKAINSNLSLPVKIILDSGSMINAMTYEIADLLKVHKRKVHVSLTGLTGKEISVKYMTNCVISNHLGDYSREIECYIVPKIVYLSPCRYVDISNLVLPENIHLADNNFNHPSHISLLLGIDIFWEILRPGQICIPHSNLVLQNTVFNYVASGTVYDTGYQNPVHCGLVQDMGELNEQVKQFWELEHITEIETFKSVEEIECNNNFIKTHKRTESGRFVVSMPLKKDPIELGESKQFAINQLNSLWRRLVRDPNRAQLYCDFMAEYRNLKHMEEVFEKEEPKIVNYLPHHCVYDPLKNPKKLRVVFNGSHVTSTGESLNSLQLNAGIIQDDLFSIVLRFRTHLYAFVADIKMMYRMILLDESQRDIQRIVWKDSIDDKIKIYRLCSVTYGTTSAPYLAQRCLKQLADDGEKQFPLAAAVVRRQMYMDDVLAGAPDLSAAKSLQTELINLFATCEMSLHKWCSNHIDLRNQENSDTYNFDQTKTLGLLWNPKTDTFCFKFSSAQSSRVTKRQVLSVIARIFDPFGAISPVVTKAKIFLQQLWRLNLNWDQSLPQRESEEWLKFHESLKTVNHISVQRYIFVDNSVKTVIFGFSDASELAFGAALYAVCLDESNTISSRLLCSKSRVAPMKTVSIPRLELSAALLLSKLMHKVTKALEIPKEDNYYFSDSTIVLSWLRKSPSDLKTFVATRVATIQSLTDIQQWRHVASTDNPSDLVSRGSDPETLKNNSLWWTGGPMCQSLTMSEFSSDCCDIPIDSDNYLREFKTSVKGDNVKLGTFLVTHENPTFFEKLFNITNDYDRLLRILCYVLRFLNRCKQNKGHNVGPISVGEKLEAEQKLLRAVQTVLYSPDKKTISGNLSNLSPFIDGKGVLRVGGRLSKASIPIHQKHPAIIPKGKLSDIIFYTMHVKQLHIGPQGLLNAVRERFWPLGGKNMARKIVRKCVVLVKEDFLPCCKWLIGRIVEVYPGSDKKVRVVKVRTPTGEIKRPIQKIAVLPMDNL